uniref:Ras-related protein Rab-18 n=1 Tax=Syphacia muris TaxID=451379 RepID=A0A0N5AEB6_9BILA
MSKAANNSSTSDNVTNCKVVILGDQNVGKSSILMRYFGHEITTDYRPTIGIDFCSKIIEKDKKMIRLYIWDTAGQERFRSLISTYLRDCNIAVVVYDITSQQSFDHLKAWFDYIHRECGDRVQTVLVGNKSDLSNQRLVYLKCCRYRNVKQAKEKGQFVWMKQAKVQRALPVRHCVDPLSMKVAAE